MSQALRKITSALNQSKTTAIFINQLREKIGVMFGSPETTTGGRALKFYASVRLDIRRIETLKDGTDAVGNRTRVKVVKNKVAPPFKQAEFDILYGQGISREGGLIDMGVEHGFVRKAGAWYTYEGDQLGQGKENARNFLKDNPDLANEIEKKIKEKLGVGVQPRGADRRAGRGRGGRRRRGRRREDGARAGGQGRQDQGRGGQELTVTRRTDWAEYADPDAPRERGGDGDGGSTGRRRGRTATGRRVRQHGVVRLGRAHGDDGRRAVGRRPRRLGGDGSRRRPRDGGRTGAGGTRGRRGVAASRPVRTEAPLLVEGREGGAAGDPVEQARAICLRLLTGTPRTRKQLADALRKREIPDEAAEEVLSRFEEVGLINDSAFADAWVESRHHGRGLARRALARELRTKGVDSTLIDEAVGAARLRAGGGDRARARRPQAALHARPRPRQAAAPPRGHARPQGLPRGHGPAGGPAGAGGGGRGHGRPGGRGF